MKVTPLSQPGDSPLRFELTGFKELERELLQFSDRLARRSLARATAAGARVVRDEARAFARTIGLYETGALVKSIRTKKERTRNWRTTAVYSIGHGGKGWYGALHERGFHPGGGDKFVQNPHLRPALDNNVPKIIDAIRTRLAQEIKVMRFEAARGSALKGKQLTQFLKQA